MIHVKWFSWRLVTQEIARERSGEERVGGVWARCEGMREVLGFCGLFLVGTSLAAAPQDGKRESRASGGEPVHLTIELSWGLSRGGAVGGIGIEGEENENVSDVLLELTEGRVVEAIAWPPEESGEGSRLSSMGPGEEGSWRLGMAREGRVRARLESPLEASLMVRRGDQVVRVPVAAMLERAYADAGDGPVDRGGGAAGLGFAGRRPGCHGRRRDRRRRGRRLPSRSGSTSSGPRRRRSRSDTRRCCGRPGRRGAVARRIGKRRCRRTVPSRRCGS